MAYKIRASDRAAFKRCRRAWDLGSRNRQNFEPVDPPRTVDLDRALHEALAVYYFPGMWEWNRSLVQSLVHQALDRSLRAQRDKGVDEQAYDQALTRGHALLDAYAAWAPTVDHFTPVHVDIDFEVNIPDPAAPGIDLATPGGEAIHYSDRIDLLALDENDAYWAVQHRLITDDWPEQDMLLLDERTIAWCWAWPLFYIDMRLVGTIHNQIHLNAGEAGAAPSAAVLGPQRMLHRRMYARAVDVPRERVRVEGADNFRRTQIVRSDTELAAAGRDLAAEARAATDSGLVAYPTPTPQICTSCAYRPPCLALNEGGDATGVLAKFYQHRPPEVVEEGRLGGSTWSMGRGAAPPAWARPTSRRP
ncbi:MAG: hypothetical protein M3308_06820 [Actinomycetota bacterium]|nr:hypothetical protein [Actinomycetota bacterium]